MALKGAGVPAAFLNSTLTGPQMQAAYRNLLVGRYKIVYVAPERLDYPGFGGVVEKLNISFIAVDEAHCISQWGQDFRPSYLKIPEFVRTLPIRPVIGAFTATATREVREDIIRMLELSDPHVAVTGFDRKISISRFATIRTSTVASVIICSPIPTAPASFTVQHAKCRRGLRQAPCGWFSGNPLSRRTFRRRTARKPGGLYLRRCTDHGRNQCVWHGHRQIQRPLCPAL